MLTTLAGKTRSSYKIVDKMIAAVNKPYPHTHCNGEECPKESAPGAGPWPALLLAP